MPILTDLKYYLQDVRKEEQKILKCSEVFKGAKKGTLFHTDFCNILLARDGTRETLPSYGSSLLLYEGKYYNYQHRDDLAMYFTVVATQSPEPLSDKYKNQYNTSPLTFIYPLKQNPLPHIVPLEDLPTYIGYKCIFPAYQKLLSRLLKPHN